MPGSTVHFELFPSCNINAQVVGQIVALRMRRPFRQRAAHGVVWLPIIVIALSDFIKLIVLQVCVCVCGL